MKRRSQLFGKTLFTDLMLNTAVMLLAIMLLSRVEPEPTKKKDVEIPTDGLYAIIMEWPNDSRDDVDLYAMDPLGAVVYFSASDIGLMHLEHDDRGASSDTVDAVGRTVSVQRNEERLIIRGAIPGEYVINAHLYAKYDPRPTEVAVTLIKLKGTDKEVAKRSHVFELQGDEWTALRFTLDDADDIVDINELERKLVDIKKEGVR